MIAVRYPKFWTNAMLAIVGSMPLKRLFTVSDSTKTKDPECLFNDSIPTLSLPREVDGTTLTNSPPVPFVLSNHSSRDLNIPTQMLHRAIVSMNPQGLASCIATGCGRDETEGSIRKVYFRRGYLGPRGRLYCSSHDALAEWRHKENVR